MNEEKVSIVLPPNMFKKGFGDVGDFVAFVVKSPRLENNCIFRVDPLNKSIVQTLLTTDIVRKCSVLDFTTIDGTPYNVFYLEGDSEWSILVEGYKNSKLMTYKGSCYIAGNVYKDENGWGVLPVKFSNKDIEGWVTFL